MSFLRFFTLPLLFLVVCCASPSVAYRDIDAGVEDASYEAALKMMENSSILASIYSSKNAILLYLDRGIVGHYAGQWEQSSRDLQQAERLIEAAFTKSISQEITSYLSSDNAKDYSGEDYEDLYINVFNALNYYHRNDMEGALVEVRRVNEKLRLLSAKYERAGEKVMVTNAGLRNPEYAIEAVSFSNSALARYLSMLFFRGDGKYDEARVDLEGLYQAYELAPAVYNHAPPSSLDNELSIPQGSARLNVIGFTGLSPVKEEFSTLILLPLPFPNDWARMALPRMIKRPSAIASIEVILDNKQSFRLELLENMGSVVEETFRANYSLILLKSIARTVIKSVTNAAISTSIELKSEGWGVFFGIAGKVAVEVTERADTRASRYLPGSAYVGGINVDPGVYNVTVNYLGRGGRVVHTEKQNNVAVKSGSLNLLEFICLK